MHRAPSSRPPQALASTTTAGGATQALARGSASLNLRQLCLLRAILIAAAALAIVLAVAGLGVPLPLIPLSIVLIALAGLNLAAWWRLHRTVEVGDREGFAHLLVDVLAYTALLYYSGGASNPFGWFYLLPVSVAAALLPRRYAWALAGLTALCYTLLLAYHHPLTGTGHALHGDFGLHILGMWIGFVFSVGLLAYFLAGMAATLRERDRQLAAAREQALRDERMVALGTLATGAAHELGTPLATMAILAQDLLEDARGTRDREAAASLRTLAGEIQRCKAALASISTAAGADPAAAGCALPVPDYVDELVLEWRAQWPERPLEVRLDGPSPAPRLLAERTLTQALMSLLRNGAQASPASLALQARWTNRELVLEVLDRGPGLHPDAARRVGHTPFSDKPDGLGIGLLLAHATVERLGGRIALAARPGGGTTTRVTLPLLDLGSDGRP